MRERDPGLDPLALEDRASVIFWRKAAADRTGKIDPLRKMATDGFCRQYAPHLATVDGVRRFVGDCAVGGVHTLGFLPAGAGESMDRAFVNVRWSGTKFSWVAGHAPRAGEETVRSSVLVMGQAPGAVTDAKQSITSAHCPRCGGPQSSGASNACEFCGAVLNDGSAGWVLLDVLAMTDPAVQAMLHQAHSPDTARLPLS